MKRLLVLLCAPMLIGAAGIAHGDPDIPAAPDPTGAAFLDSLHAAGITYSRMDLVIATAEAVCKLVRSGNSGPQVLANLRNSNPGLAPEQGGQFLAIAIRSYCPDLLGPANPANPAPTQ